MTLLSCLVVCERRTKTLMFYSEIVGLKNEEVPSGAWSCGTVITVLLMT